MTDLTPRYVSPEKAGQALDVSSDTLKRWAKDGKIEHIKLPSGHYRYNLAAFLKGQQNAEE